MKNRVCIKMMRNVKEDVPSETVFCRFDLQQWRTFTSNQNLTFRNLPPNYSLEKTSEIGARPPELVFVASLKLYFTAFVISKKVCKREDDHNKTKSTLYHWVDGFGRIVVIDDVYVPIISEEARSSSTSGKKILELFDVGLSNCEIKSGKIISSFIAEQSECLFIHLLLTLLEFWYVVNYSTMTHP